MTLLKGLMGVVLFILRAQEEAPHWFFGSAQEEALGMQKQETLTLQEKFSLLKSRAFPESAQESPKFEDMP